MNEIRRTNEIEGAPAGVPAAATRHRVLGVEILSATTAEAIAWLDEASAPTFVAFANANLLNIAARDPALRDVLRRFVILNDGIGVDIAARMLDGRGFAENLNGTDFTPAFLADTAHARRIFLLGADADSVAEAAARLAERFPRHRIVGHHHGYLSDDDHEAIVDRIKLSGADTLLVAMGNPRQERWIARHGASTGCTLIFGVGALFDFLAGRVVRAPRLVRQARMEWLFRLAQEPRRLAERYLIGNGLFLYRVARQRRQERQRRGRPKP